MYLLELGLAFIIHSLHYWCINEINLGGSEWVNEIMQSYELGMITYSMGMGGRMR